MLKNQFSLYKREKGYLTPTFLEEDATVDAAMQEPDSSWPWIAAMDVSETEKEIKIKMELPGVSPEDIRIEIDQHTLWIVGETAEENREEGEIWHCVERKSGRFSRIINLTEKADMDHIYAKSKNGVLTIRIPKISPEQE